MDQAVSLLESQLADDQEDSDLQLELAFGYLQKLGAANAYDKAKWALKADQAFDGILAMDENHWDARFSKAVSLSFWPPILGKQPEAEKQFEILMDKQEQMVEQPEFTQTYVLLSNIYLQQGRKEEALDVLNRGLSLFPGDTELHQRISDLEML